MLAARHVVFRPGNLRLVGSVGCRALSSFFEPNPTLFHVSEKDFADKNAPLRDDVRTMGSLLGNVIQERQGKDIFDKVEKLRHLAKVRS
jgi:hypothetical protein